jgi:hypothetical protein
MLEDPRSGKWIKVAQTADCKMRVTGDGSGGDTTAVEEYRVYYGGDRFPALYGSRQSSSERVVARVTRGRTRTPLFQRIFSSELLWQEAEFDQLVMNPVAYRLNQPRKPLRFNDFSSPCTLVHTPGA